MIIDDVCDMYEEHAEDDVNAADAGSAGCVYPFITGCQMLPVHQLR